jgi:hypothetical protein
MAESNKRLARLARIWQTEAEFQAELSRIYRGKKRLGDSVTAQRKSATAAEKARDAVLRMGLAV